MEKDLSLSSIHTDLIEDSIDKKLKTHKIDVSYYDIKRKKDHFLKGFYTLICFLDITDHKNYENVKKVFKKELNSYIKGYHNVFVVGLGNKNVTPDSLGPKVVEDILVTAYLDKIENGFIKTYAISPSVKGATGINTKDYVSSLVKKLKPELVIFIDSLASKNINHLCKAIQISDAGIYPGSSEGYTEDTELSKKTLHTNTVTIGVPTVVDSMSIFLDIVSRLDIKIKTDLKPDLFFVTPKEIDFQLTKIAYLISSSINECLHKSIR